MMRESFVALVASAAVLVALFAVYSEFAATRRIWNRHVHRVLTGVVLGATGILVMLMPYAFARGITVDARSILLAMSGLFYGPVPTTIAMLMTAAFRLVQGGMGTAKGISIIVASGAVGMIWRLSWRRRLSQLSFWPLFSMGLVVHLAMLALTFILPLETALAVLREIALPVLLVYPIATAAIGMLIVDHLRRDEAATAVAESAIEFKALLEQAAVGVTKTKISTGKYVFVNQRFAEIVGYTREELLTMSFHDITDPADLATDLSNEQLLIAGTLHEYAMEKRYIRKNGTAVWVNLTASPLGMPGETPRYLIGIIEDITDRKKAEQEVRTLNAELEERVRRRTADLEAANRELEAFSYSVSHDLRAPLRSIDGFSQAAIEDSGGVLPELARQDLERVRLASQRMGQLIDDMLLLARVARSEMHVQQVDMTELARDAANDLISSNPGRVVQLDVEPGMTAMGDPRLLRIVFANLLDNAWKFTSRHEHAHVAVGTVEDPDHGHAFFVRDDGAGFDPRYASKLFVAFQRLHSLEEFPGTGIGLATVWRAVRRHGGSTWAEGEIDHGATFYFTIPDLHTSILDKEE